MQKLVEKTATELSDGKKQQSEEEEKKQKEFQERMDRKLIKILPHTNDNLFDTAQARHLYSVIQRKIEKMNFDSAIIKKSEGSKHHESI